MALLGVIERICDAVGDGMGVHLGIVAVAIGVAVGVVDHPPNCGQVGVLSISYCWRSLSVKSRNTREQA